MLINLTPFALNILLLFSLRLSGRRGGKISSTRLKLSYLTWYARLTVLISYHPAYVFVLVLVLNR